VLKNRFFIPDLFGDLVSFIDLFVKKLGFPNLEDLGKLPLDVVSHESENF